MFRDGAPEEVEGRRAGADMAAEPAERVKVDVKEGAREKASVAHNAATQRRVLIIPAPCLSVRNPGVYQALSL